MSVGSLLGVFAASVRRIAFRAVRLRAADEDAVTGLGDAHAFEAGFAASRSDCHELSLLITDIDLFMPMRARMGEKAADQVLRGFAECAQGVVGNDFTFFRLGPDRFCCLLAGTSEEVAASVGEAVRMRFASMPILTHAGIVRGTVSVGVACSGDVGFSVAALKAAAEVALLEAQRQGRDRVVTFGAVPSPDHGQSAKLGTGALLPSSLELTAALR